MGELIEVSQQLEEIETEELKERRHMEALELVNGLKDMYPNIPPSLLYTAALDYIYHPDKTEPDYEKDEDLRKEIEEMKQKSDDIKGIIQGIEVVD